MLVLLALVSGVSAVVGIRRLHNQVPLAPRFDAVAIVVAARAIPRGTTVSADSVRMLDYPKELVPGGAITQVDDAVGRLVSTPLAKDEPLLDIKLAAKGAGRGMAPLIPKGMRTIAIQTPTVPGSGFILPGNKVDVLMIPNTQSGNDPRSPRTTVLQNVEVWAIGQRMEAPPDNKMDSKELREVTLLVLPEQAMTLAEAQNKGILHLALRNSEDKEYAFTWSQRLQDIKGILESAGKLLAECKHRSPSQLPRIADPEPVFIHILRGTQEGLVPIARKE